MKMLLVELTPLGRIEADSQAADRRALDWMDLEGMVSDACLGAGLANTGGETWLGTLL
jgi:hypothetical protein